MGMKLYIEIQSYQPVLWCNDLNFYIEIQEYKQLRENKIHKTTQRQNRRITDREGKETIDGLKPNETFSSLEKIEILTNL